MWIVFHCLKRRAKILHCSLIVAVVVEVFICTTSVHIENASITKNIADLTQTQISSSELDDVVLDCPDILFNSCDTNVFIFLWSDKIA